MIAQGTNNKKTVQQALSEQPRVDDTSLVIFNALIASTDHQYVKLVTKDPKKLVYPRNAAQEAGLPNSARLYSGPNAPKNTGTAAQTEITYNDDIDADGMIKKENVGAVAAANSKLPSFKDPTGKVHQYPFAGETFETVSLFKHIVQTAILSLYVVPQTADEAKANAPYIAINKSHFERARWFADQMCDACLAQASYIDEKRKRDNAVMIKNKYEEMKAVLPQGRAAKGGSGAASAALVKDFKLSDSDMQALSDDIADRFGFAPQTLFGKDWFSSLANFVQEMDSQDRADTEYFYENKGKGKGKQGKGGKGGVD